MKALFSIITVSAAFLLLSFTGVEDDIATALRQGQAFKVSAHFHEKVDILILDEGDLVTKLEAEKMLYDFFYQKKITNFEILHRGDSNGGLIYIIGKLSTSSDNYRVSYYITNNKENAKIQQFFIDAE
jgi:hypothetical protein